MYYLISPPQRMPKLKTNLIVTWCVSLFFGGVITSLSVAMLAYQARSGPEPRIRGEIKSLEAVLEVYRTDFGSYPPLANAAIVKALSGSNSAKKEYYFFREHQLNGKGELLDPWGSPYQFSMGQYGPTIISAGKNRRWGDDDDESNVRK
jgi:hypothetical protein